MAVSKACSAICCSKLSSELIPEESRCIQKISELIQELILQQFIVPALIYNDAAMHVAFSNARE